MLVHHVLFWLRPETSDTEKQAFRDGLQALEAIDSVKSFHVGVPAIIDRPVVDRSYTFSLLIFFDSLAAHDAYQVDSLHQAFLARFRPAFERVVIYDAA